MMEFYQRVPESPLQCASFLLVRSWDKLQEAERCTLVQASLELARGECFCSSLYLHNSPLFLPRHACLLFKDRIFLRTQFSDFKGSQCLQKVSKLNAEIIFKMSVLILWAELMLIWCLVLLKKFWKLENLFKLFSSLLDYLLFLN